MTRSRILIGALLAVGLGAVSQSRGQVPLAPCSTAVAGQPIFSASDLDELQSSRLIATHTLELTTDFGATLVDDGSVAFSVPASATVIRPHGDVNAGATAGSRNERMACLRGSDGTHKRQHTCRAERAGRLAPMIRNRPKC